MSFLNKHQPHKTCPKTGKIIKTTRYNRILWLFFPITGLAALVWFLIRVIPKPSRAIYPCQRVAFPIASGFVVWLIGITGSAVAYHKAKRALSQTRYILAAVCIVASVGFILTAMSSTNENIGYAHEPIVSNSPIGQAIGVKPGRVAWIHDPNATNWSGGTTSPYPYENTCTNQTVVNEMFSKGIRTLAGEYTDADAWDAIFRNFNQRMGKGDVGYTPGEKIAIKINFVLMYSNPWDGTMPTNVLDQISNSPQLAIALLKQLINVVGVSPGDISIGDAQMMMPNHWYNMVYAQCPGVVYMTKAGTSHSGRTAVTLDTSAPFYWSDPCSAHWSGVTQQDYIPTHLAQCNYFINFPVLKSHNSGGVTLSGKNHYGSLSRTPNASGYYNMHNTRPANDDGSPFATPGMGYYRANVDLMGHPKLGGKTMLVLIDGLYAGRSWDSQPIKWQMPPFNNDWPSSIFLSQDQVAADSVAFDFMDNEWDGPLPPPSTNINGYPQYSGTDDYLHEAALVPSPPSGTNYDPNDDGGLTESLGVHEHWNNATDKQYSRNLDPVNGTGIELVTAVPEEEPEDPNVNFVDFASFAQAWSTSSGDANWNADWDISLPADNVIDIDDLVILAECWLNPLITGLVADDATLQSVYYENNINFEGATWDPNSDKLFFTRRSSPWRILRLDSPNNVTVWLDSAPQTNGMLISLDGRLLACDENPMQVSSRHIGLTGPGDTQILADSSDGFTYQPNDLCQLANGNIYFTTPTWNAGVPPSSQGVWLLKPDGSVTRVNNTLYQPNGIITSLDETKLYVSEGSTNTSYQRWRVFNINTDGTLGSPTTFFDPVTAPDTSNVPDGMTIDQFGNLYFTGLGGVWIVSPAGQQLDFITVTSPLNICFGGTDGKTLYITAKHRVWSLQMQVRGGELDTW